MKKRLPAKLMMTALLSVWLLNGCAEKSVKSASGASPEAMAAIENAESAIQAAKANDWIWRDTEDFLQQAREAAEKGDNQAAMALAEKARFEAEAAVVQYNYETDHPRGI